MVGQQLSLIPGNTEFVVQHLARKRAFAVGRLPCGKEHWTRSWHLWPGSAAGQLWSHSSAEPCWSISPLSGGLALPFQLLHTQVQGISCSLKVAQAKHKTQIKVVTMDCTY